MSKEYALLGTLKVEAKVPRKYIYDFMNNVGSEKKKTNKRKKKGREERAGEGDWNCLWVYVYKINEVLRSDWSMHHLLICILLFRRFPTIQRNWRR